MNRLHVIGGKNHGKTTLIVELIGALRERGLRVGTIKHTHHRHELDTPGKDSHRHRLAGSSIVGVLSRELAAVYVPTTELGSQPDDWYAAMAPAFAGCPIVLVEGGTETAAPKIEVWRAAGQSQPHAIRIPNVLAMVTDDPIELDLPVFPRSDLAPLVDWIVARSRGATPSAIG